MKIASRYQLLNSDLMSPNSSTVKQVAVVRETRLLLIQAWFISSNVEMLHSSTTSLNSFTDEIIMEIYQFLLDKNTKFAKQHFLKFEFENRFREFLNYTTILFKLTESAENCSNM